METLQLLLEHAQAERDRCLAAAESAQGQHRAGMDQYEQLVGYRHDYEARWQAQFSRQGTMEVVHAYQGFMLRLSQAVDHQHAAVEQAAGRAEAARAVLREREIKVASVRKLIERRSERERAEQRRREQKLSDEHGARGALDSVLPSGFAPMYREDTHR